jgi:hypothetical protein
MTGKIAREAEHIDPEKGYSFRITVVLNFGVIVDVQCVSLIPGLFEELCSRFSNLMTGKLPKDAYFIGIEGFQKQYGTFSSDMEREACEILFATFQRALAGSPEYH